MQVNLNYLLSKASLRPHNVFELIMCAFVLSKSLGVKLRWHELTLPSFEKAIGYPSVSKKGWA